MWSNGEKDKYCREISFHPYQVVAANAPVGWIQTVRNAVYAQEQDARHHLMGQPQTDWDSAWLQKYLSL